MRKTRKLLKTIRDTKRTYHAKRSTVKDRNVIDLTKAEDIKRWQEYIKLVMPSNHLILCHTLLFLPSIFSIIRVCSNESVLCIKWSKYWSFSFNISLSNEYSVLISFRIDCFQYRRLQKRSSWPRLPRWCDHSPRARYPGMWSQVGLRKHQLERKLVEVMVFQLSYFKF